MFSLRKRRWTEEEVQTWRAKNNVDHILDGLPPNYEILQKIVPNGHAGFDKLGRPIYWSKIGPIHVDLFLRFSEGGR